MNIIFEIQKEKRDRRFYKLLYKQSINVSKTNSDSLTKLETLKNDIILSERPPFSWLSFTENFDFRFSWNYQMISN